MIESFENKNNPLSFSNNELARQLFGEHNHHLQIISKATGVNIHARGNTVFIEGDTTGTELAENVLHQLYGLLKEKYPIYPRMSTTLSE